MDDFTAAHIQTGETSIVGTWYAEEGGPIALWRAWSEDVQGHSLSAGHFLPDEASESTAEALNRFFGTAG
jgi:haloacetate dehalogenase